jgi:serine/threonine protein kinase
MTNCPQCGAPAKPEARYCTKCGVRLAAAGLADDALTESLPVGTALQGGRYQIIGQLGQGGMGAVYLARDMELFGRLCVIKQMRPFFATQSERRRAEEDFKREAEVLVRLNHPGHPRIPEVYGYFVEGLDQFLVMKYIEGESLERRLERIGRPLAETEVIWCAQEVANALVYLHSRKPQPVIHRDIKPANIIVDPKIGSGWWISGWPRPPSAAEPGSWSPEARRWRLARPAIPLWSNGRCSPRSSRTSMLWAPPCTTC